MSSITVHQCLHGYRRGHELLAGSMRLPSSVADLVTRLSDLSGSVASGWQFTSYLTGYPLTGAGLFALARTWEDIDAPRAGCVLTHTLLIPVQAWCVSPSPHKFSDLFATPEELRTEDRFKKPLHYELDIDAAPSPIQLPHETAVDFVRKFFGEGLRPLIWFDCPDPEGVAWSVVRVLWPALRSHFSWCTASLQPRSIDTSFLDLQFAPSEAYPRFHKIPPENVVSAEPVRTGSRSEPWHEPCAQWIFSGHQPGPIDKEIREFGPSLRNDSTLLRNLFLARDLSVRVSVSPPAGVGLLDVIETLAPDAHEAADYKFHAAHRAINAAMSATPDEALKCLFLVGERLMDVSFQTVVTELAPWLTCKVDELSAHYPREALLMPERVLSSSDSQATPYYQGLVQGLTRCAHDTPSELVCLHEFDKTASHLIASSPPIARGYLRGVRISGAGEPQALIEWITGCHDPALRKLLRRELLPELHDDDDTALAEVLLLNLPLEEVGMSLSIIAHATNDFAPLSLLATLQELVAIPYPEVVREWALANERWSANTASLLAVTFAQDRTGLAQLVEMDLKEDLRRAELLSAFLDSCTATRAPGWFKDAAHESADWLVQIVSLGDRLPSSGVALLERLLPQLRDVPIALQPDMLNVMPSLIRLPFWPSLINLTLRSAVTTFVEGRLSESHCRAWFFEEWSSKWVGDISRSELASVLIHPVNDIDRRERSFRWLSFAPFSLYQRQPMIVPGLFWELVSDRRCGWTPAMGDAWAKCIRRVQETASDSQSLRMCTEILQFGFDHISEPVGAAVAAAFYPVYRTVCDSGWTPVEVSKLFSWLDWDKAKELRKGLVRAFTHSQWAPGDLAIAARDDEQLLRKLVKRILRLEHGEMYLTSVLKDLASRTTPEAARAVAIINELASNPEFYEPWD